MTPGRGLLSGTLSTDKEAEPPSGPASWRKASCKRAQGLVEEDPSIHTAAKTNPKDSSLKHRTWALSTTQLPGQIRRCSNTHIETRIFSGQVALYLG